MRWDDLYAFVVIIEKGTLTKASRNLKCSIATLTRKLDRLEKTLGLILARRGTAGVQLTNEGRQIYEIARVGYDELGKVLRLADALKSGQKRPPVRISSTEPIISGILAPALHKLLKEQSEIQVDLTVSSDISNLHRQETDLAIRLARPKEPTLLTRKLGTIRLRVYVSRSLLAERNPDMIKLNGLPLLSFNTSYGDIPEVEWVKQHNLEDQVIFNSSSTRALMNAAQDGLGAAILPDFLAGKSDELIAISHPPIPNRQLWLVSHRDMKSHPYVTHVKQWIIETCRDILG